MHSRLLVTLTCHPNVTSDDVRQQVYDFLLADTSFCGGGGRFWNSLCDWFVIGGGWTGLLAETLMQDEFKVKARALAGVDHDFPTQSDIDRHATEFDSLWQSLGGIGSSPYSRSIDTELGYADDAMLISQELYDALLAEDEGLDTDGESVVDLDGDEISRAFIGHKWLVVIDYHS